MTTHTGICNYCGAIFAAKRSDARYCSHSHRTRASQAASAERHAHLGDLLLRQTRAIIRGADAAELDAIAMEADALFAA